MIRYPGCILATCVVPWDERGEFIESLFVDEVNVLLKLTKHLYVFGTAGEGYAVTDRQFERIAKVFHDVMRAGRAEPMVGVVSLSLGTIIERIEKAREIGVRHFQLSLPSWGALTDKEVAVFFRETCGRFPDCRFLHYNLMRTKRLVTPEEYARLALEHPNLVATKNSTDSMDRLQKLMRLAPALRLFPNETGFVHASELGECGLLASLVPLNANACRAFFEAGLKGDRALLLEMQREIVELTQQLIALAGADDYIDGAFDKMLWKMHDDRFPLRLLPPYNGASEEGFRKFAEVVRTRFPRWNPVERGGPS